MEDLIGKLGQYDLKELQTALENGEPYDFLTTDAKMSMWTANVLYCLLQTVHSQEIQIKSLRKSLQTLDERTAGSKMYGTSFIGGAR